MRLPPGVRGILLKYKIIFINRLQTSQLRVEYESHFLFVYSSPILFFLQGLGGREVE